MWKWAFIKYPVVFIFGWLFNFIIDIQFLLGFALGWLTHSWIGNLFI